MMRDSPLSSSRYLLRFDDICPSMNWPVWNRIEEILERYGIRPILAVIPDNRDPKLSFQPPDPRFWEKVRAWQSRNYTIAVHGYQHLYVNRNPGMMRLKRDSEFAGLPFQTQEDLVKRARMVFEAEGVHADVWVAPSHSFDETTVAALASQGIRIISDGLWPWPFTDHRGITWIPVQLPWFEEKSYGVWTVCCHHNSWTAKDIKRLAEQLETFASRMTDVPTVLRDFGGRKLTLRDRIAAAVEFVWNHRLPPARVWFRRFVPRRG
jgi:predicted deacetylase